MEERNGGREAGKMKVWTAQNNKAVQGAGNDNKGVWLAFIFIVAVTAAGWAVGHYGLTKGIGGIFAYEIDTAKGTMRSFHPIGDVIGVVCGLVLGVYLGLKWDKSDERKRKEI